jgi:hypothetical protein
MYGYHTAMGTSPFKAMKMVCTWNTEPHPSISIFYSLSKDGPEKWIEHQLCLRVGGQPGSVVAQTWVHFIPFQRHIHYKILFQFSKIHHV